jgi:5-methylcytosine-specific restriction endonuclease McrA
VNAAYAALSLEQKALRLEATRQWRKRNPQKMRAGKKDWLRRNPGKNAEHCRNFRKAHPEKAAASVLLWKHANPEQAAGIASAGVRRYQARKASALCDCCATISFKFSYLQAKALGMEVDHIRPLSKGGKHCLRNLQLLERHDNRVKHAKWEAA